MKLPSYQFYPGDWMKDPALRSVGYAARGLWKDMLCLMHESVRRGYLQHENGKPVTAEQIARMTGGSPEEVSLLLKELEDSGVFSRSEHGAIYSRRLVRQEQLRKKQIEYGKQGGNPALMGGVKARHKVKANPKITPSVSSSVSVSKQTTDDSPPNPDDPARLTPIQRLVRFYKHLLGVGKDNPEWDRANFAKYAPQAKEFLGYFNDGVAENDVKDALRALRQIYRKITSSKAKDGQPLSLSIIGATRHIAEWRVNRGKYDANDQSE